MIVGPDVDVGAGMSCKAGGSSVDSITVLTSSLLTEATCRLLNLRLHHICHDPLCVLCLPMSCNFSLIPERCRPVPMVQGPTFPER